MDDFEVIKEQEAIHIKHNKKVALKVSIPPRDNIGISNTNYINFSIQNIGAEEATVALMVRRSLVERVLPKRIPGSNPGRGASAFILLNLTWRANEYSQ